eukprot:scpid104205/ scgid21802/ 
MEIALFTLLFVQLSNFELQVTSSPMRDEDCEEISLNSSIWEPSVLDGDSESELLPEMEAGSQERKFIVCESRLDALLRDDRCPECAGCISRRTKTTCDPMLTVTLTCCNGHTSTWKSQTRTSIKDAIGKSSHCDCHSSVWGDI